MRVRALPAVLGLVLLSGCAQHALLTKRDYAPSLTAFSLGDYPAAQQDSPSAEAGTFITTMEQTYLALLQGHADLAPLLEYRNLAEDRIRYVVSREIKSLFYVSTPEGYYASEHEIIWMHLLLSWGFSLQGKSEQACVEAREAGELLTAPWSEEGHFDDPTLRILLAAFWATCGSWEDAQVDLRRAAELDPSLTWARDLSRSAAPPRTLILVLGGIGPEPYWDPALELNPLRGARHLGFMPRGRRTPMVAENSAARIPLYLTPSSAPWYQRHLVRDNAIQDVIQDSRYAVDTAFETGLRVGSTAAGVGIWVGATALGLAGSYAIVYLCSTGSCSGEALYGIIGLPIIGFMYGREQYRQIEGSSRRRFREQTDPANFYRFVRFLPEYAWLGWSDDPLGAQVELLPAEGRPTAPVGILRGPLPGPGLPRVFIGHLPDVP